MTTILSAIVEKVMKSHDFRNNSSFLIEREHLSHQKNKNTKKYGSIKNQHKPDTL